MSTNAEWYWAKKDYDERYGPVSKSQLEELAGEGKLEPDDLVWKEGMDDWEEASSVEGVKDLFKSPPPLPEESVEESVAQDEAPPLPDDDTKQRPPAEFRVEWGKSSMSGEANLYLRKNRIELEASSAFYEGGKINYSEFKVEKLESNRLVAKVPPGFDSEKKNFLVKESEEVIVFDSEKLAKEAVDIIEGVKSREMGVGDQLDTEAADDEKKETATEEGQDPFWKRHPIWTGVIAVFLLGALSNALDSGSGGTNSSEATSSCKAEAGVYSGNYTAATPSGPEQGEASFILSDDCSYTVSMDGSRMGTGQAVSTSDGSFELENGNTIRIDGGTARMEENGSNYQVTYEMRKVE